LDIIVEIGTDEQKKIIENELFILIAISEILDPPAPIKSIIVANDFDRTVNDLQQTQNYCSSRGEHLAVAKNVYTKDGIHLVFSAFLFTNEQDNITRFNIYLHEFLHAYNSLRFPSLITESKTEYQYLTNLYILYDEYDVDRKSLQIVDRFLEFNKIKNTKYDQLHRLSTRKHIKGFIKIINNEKYYNNICFQISSFRFHRNVIKFLDAINPLFDEISKSIIHTYSYIDFFPKLYRIFPLINKSKFVNDKTITLTEYFRKKFDDNEPDLLDGIELIKRFMENFGMRFEDTKNGLYCHVLDI
jgi:hypothetical protein